MASPTDHEIFARSCAAAAVLGLAVLTAGCANTLRSRPLATGEPQVAAYELHGLDLRDLRAEALRLCGGPAEVLRESAGGSAAPPARSRIGRWWVAAAEWVDPPVREAQMTVRCDLRPDGARVNLSATEAPRAVAVIPAGKSSPAIASLRGPRSMSLRAPDRSPPAADAAVPYGF